MTIYESFPDAEALAAGVLRDGLGARVYSSIPKTPISGSYFIPSKSV